MSNRASRTSEMLASLRSKIDKTVGHRGDLHIEDSSKIDGDSVYAMIRYSPDFGVPSTEDLVAFVGAEFGGSIRPVLESAVRTQKDDTVLMILSRNMLTRPFEEAQEMVPVTAGAVYMDRALRDTWSVEHGSDGTPFLKRICDDDIGQIVADRRRRMTTAGQKRMSISAALNNCVPHANEGDVVRVFWNGMPVSGCLVMAVGANDLTLQVPNCGQVAVAKSSVMKIEETSPKKLKEMKKQLEEYYKKAYGNPEYAEELTDETTRR